MAMLLPAVQSAREAARRVQCASRLRQFGIANAQFETSRGAYPKYLDTVVAPDDPEIEVASTFISAHTQILPYMEQQALYDMTIIVGGDGGMGVEMFRCPSVPDSRPTVNSYPINVGSHEMAGDGIFPVVDRRDISSRDVRDGLSQTLLAAEWAPSDDAVPPRLWMLLVDGPGDPPERFRDDCLAAHASPDEGSRLFAAIGYSWFDNVGYDHLLPPFSGGCETRSQLYRTKSAASFHPDGFHGAFADGSVRFLTGRIDPEIWRALGTRSGREIVGAF